MGTGMQRWATGNDGVMLHGVSDLGGRSLVKCLTPFVVFRHSLDGNQSQHAGFPLSKGLNSVLCQLTHPLGDDYCIATVAQQLCYVRDQISPSNVLSYDLAFAAN
jgi:hypothetical protein